MLACANPEIAALRHGVNGVDHHCEHNLLDLVGVAANVGQLLAQPQVQLDVAHVHLVLNQADAAVDHLREVGPLQVHGRNPREGQQVLHKFAATLALAGDEVERSRHLLGARCGREVVLNPTLHHSRIGEDAGKRIVDLMRDNSGHLPDGGHLFNLQHVLVCLL